MPSRSLAAPPGLLLVATAAVLWALIGLFTPALLDEGVAPLEIAFWRSALGGALFLFHATRRDVVSVGGWRPALALAAFGSVAVGLFYAALVYAIELGGVSLAWILLYTAPAWVAIASVLVLRRRVTWLRAGLVLVTMGGVTLVAVGGGRGISVTVASVAWGLTSGLSYSAWYIAGSRLLDRHGPVTISAWSMLAGAVVLALVADLRPLSVRAAMLLAGLAFVSTYLPALAYYSGLGRVDPTRASIVATIEPVIAFGIGVAVEGERLGAVAAAGGLAVIGAAVLAALRGD